MLAIDPAAGLVALAVLYAIYQYLQRTAGPARWADSRRSHHLQRIREHLLAAAAEPEHPRYWRPQILLFSGEPDSRRALLEFAGWIQAGSGFTAAVKILVGQTARPHKERKAAESELREDIENAGLEAFPLVLVAPDYNQAVQLLVQTFGIGPVHANTALFSWTEKFAGSAEVYMETVYGRSLRSAYRFGCNLILLSAGVDAWRDLSHQQPENRRIDVWWRDDATGGLMLLLAHLITRNKPWQDARVRLLAANPQTREEQSMFTTEGLQGMLDEVRITAEPLVVEHVDAEEIVACSADAALVLLPFRLRNTDLQDPFGGPLDPLLTRLPVTALILAAEEIDLDAAPEEGEAGERANALDALSDAEKRVAYAEKEVERAGSLMDDLKKKLQAAEADPRAAMDTAAVQSMLVDLAAAEQMLSKAFRRLARERAKVDAAERRPKRWGPKLVTTPRVDRQSGARFLVHPLR
jgi:hypothetical protein